VKKSRRACRAFLIGDRQREAGRLAEEREGKEEQETRFVGFEDERIESNYP